MECIELISDKVEFTRLSDECRAVFDLERRLPQRVFRRDFNKYYAFEYVSIFFKYFAPFLVDVSKVFSDKAVNYMTIDPIPDYYFSNYGFYGLASFEPAKLNSDYMKIMTRDGMADSFRTGGNVGIFWGSSLKWGIFCDRKDWELCVMGVSQEFDEAIMSSIRKMDLSQVQSYIAAAYHWKPSVAAEFADAFPKNYFLS